MNYLLDTNVISETVCDKPKTIVMNWLSSISPDNLYLSVLVTGEIRKGVEQLKICPRRKHIEHWLEHELPVYFRNRILDVTQAIGDCWGKLLGAKKSSVPAIDSLLAATAIHHNLCLVTRNTKDFQYPNLEIFNPWDAH